MIQYSLKCADDHLFESWFQSAQAFDKLSSAGLLTCAVCGKSDVSKGLMTPAVRSAHKGDVVASDDAPLSTPATPAEKAIAEIRSKVEATSEYVGSDFANKAREMHDGDTPEKPIYGEANLQDAKKLIEDGIPVLPLPFRPSGKDN